MRILEWHIDRFGGLVNVSQRPASGFNLLLGSNEDGKSTTMAFIRAMFYGLNSQAHSLLENDRKRLMPWGESTMGGWLSFIIDRRHYRVERTFGLSRRFDRTLLRDETTGLAVDHPSRLEIGEFLFQVSEQEFINTVFIGQLSSTRIDPDGGTLAKLTNLATTGDERHSSDEIDARLRKAMVRLKAEKGGGGLLAAELSQKERLIGERRQVLDLETERADLFRQFRELSGECDQIRQTVTSARQLLGSCQDWVACQHADTVMKIEQERSHLEESLAQVSGALIVDGKPIDAAWIQGLRARLSGLTVLEARLTEMEKARQELTRTLTPLQAQMVDLTAIEHLNRDLFKESLDEARRLEAKQLAVRRLSLELREVQNERNEQLAVLRQAAEKRALLEVSLGHVRTEMAAAYQQIAEEAEAKRNAVEAQKQELARSKDNRASDRQLRRSIWLSVAAGLLLMAVGAAGGLRTDPLAWALVPVGFLTGLGFALRALKIRKTRAGLQAIERAALTRLVLSSNQELEDCLRRQKTLQVTHEQREAQLNAQFAASCRAQELAQASLDRAAEAWYLSLDRIEDETNQTRMGLTADRELVENSDTFITPSMLADPESSDIEARLWRLDDLLKQLGQAVLDQLEAHEAGIREQVEAAGCTSPEALLVMLEQFQSLQEQRDRLLRQLNLTESFLDKVRAEQAEQDQALRQALPASGAKDASLTLADQIEALSEAVERRQMLSIAFTERQASLRTITGSRPVRQILEEAATTRARLQAACPRAPADLIEALNEVEQGLADRIDLTGHPDLSALTSLIEQMHERLRERETERVKAESDLKSRYAVIRNLEDIESDLARSDTRLRHMQADYEAMALARRTLDEAFHELQQSFGPRLNQRGGAILSGLTGGRYQAMRVDRTFQVHVEEPGSGVLRDSAFLSGGTGDQVYLALRLAVAELIGDPARPLPLCLDDVFVQYDDQRALDGLQFLRRYAEEQNRQVLLFSCHERMARLPGVTPVRLRLD